MPVLRPAARKMPRIKSTVLVLPLVPVTPIRMKLLAGEAVPGGGEPGERFGGVRHLPVNDTFWDGSS